MFEDARQSGGVDRVSLTVTEVADWLDDHEYEVAETVRAGELRLSEPGFAVAGENDAVTLAYVSEDAEEPVMRTFGLDELWDMDEEEFTEQVEEMTREV